MRKTARIFSLLIAAALLAARTPVIAAAEEEEPIHECTAVVVTVVDEQSHIVDCSECGESVTEAHSFGDWEVQDAQCHVRVCTCGASVTEAHTWDDGVLEEATGVRTYTCTACFSSYTETVKTSTDEDAETSSEGGKDQIPENPLIGDVDGDGQVTASDLMIISAISQGRLSSATELQLRAADINQDGWVNIVDVVSIYTTLID